MKLEVGGPLRDAHINPKAHYLDYFAKAWTPDKTQKKNDIRGNCDRRDKIQFHGPFVTIHPRRTYSPSPKVGWKKNQRYNNNLYHLKVVTSFPTVNVTFLKKNFGSKNGEKKC